MGWGDQSSDSGGGDVAVLLSYDGSCHVFLRRSGSLLLIIARGSFEENNLDLISCCSGVFISAFLPT